MRRRWRSLRARMRLRAGKVLVSRELVQMAAAVMAVEGHEVLIEQARFGYMTGVNGERLMVMAETLYDALDEEMGIARLPDPQPGGVRATPA